MRCDQDDYPPNCQHHDKTNYQTQDMRCDVVWEDMITHLPVNDILQSGFETFLALWIILRKEMKGKVKSIMKWKDKRMEDRTCSVRIFQFSLMKSFAITI